jgi:coproporphyrinogen III oxidase-like Fe-S oxidoreductase
MSTTHDRLKSYLETSAKKKPKPVNKGYKVSEKEKAAQEVMKHHREQHEHHKKKADYHKGFSETTPNPEDKKFHKKLSEHHKAEAVHHAKSYGKASKLG